MRIETLNTKFIKVQSMLYFPQEIPELLQWFQEVIEN